jgi:hypothetical protein
MKNRKRDRRDIEAEVQKTLRGLDHVEKVKAKPFFFMRLQHRLDALQAQKSQPEVSSIFATFLRPALMPLLIVVSIGVGILIGYKTPTSSRAEAASVLVEAYGLNAPDLTQYTLTSNQ